MKKQRKSAREKGKRNLSRMFQKLKIGDRVCLARDVSNKGKASFPRRLEGRTGVVEGERGRAYIVQVNDHNAKKRFIIKPVHLKKLK